MASLAETKPRPGALRAEARARVAPLIDRLLWERTKIRRSTLLFGDFCQGLQQLGVPIGRASIHMRQVHPLLLGRTMLWLADSGGAMETGLEHGTETDPRYLDSPIRRIFEGAPSIRRRLEDPGCPMDFPILHDLVAEGWSDYTMYALPFSTGPINAIGFSTGRKGGFSELDLATIEAALPVFGAIMEINYQRRTARTLMQTYLGPKTGERVLTGAIKRGDGEVIEAVLWYCDLRDFTPLSESLPVEQVIDLLNDYFETMARPVKAAGGEIVKFIGDAMLAIFPLGGRGPHQSCGACWTALQVSEQALEGMAALNQARTAAGKPLLRCGVALARGDVMYGNIGDQERLDFTVIGPAVNQATRLEELTRDLKLDPPIVFSAQLAAHCGRPTRSLGHFQLKGIAEQQEAFTLA
jgi:adenylate cyclase